ncbi:uncharacterized protein IUM83_06624 [Phytophthora cinnamomi]|uniref:uncharacterized protein n=1 Tax=Phytophthora cinnamomi TaxID=4785 RepID=UPI00355A6D62|nr:hypothetical protein IUM83_06624 [Phytophthora cinnamomi]
MKVPTSSSFNKKQKQPPKKEKIRTYCRRKAEIEVLMDEMARLNAEVEFYAKRNQVLKEREELRHRQESNQALREVLHAQRLAFASSMSLVSQVLREKHTGPFDMLTHLPKDPYARHIELLRMKQERVQRAYDFMRERQRFMDTSTESCDQKKFHAMNGDLCSERFEVIPLPGATSIKAIVDALDYFVYNIEICMSEVLGDITVRENDDPQRSSSVAQHRLVTTIGDVVQMDTNNVAFNEYIPAGPNQKEVGFSISDAVDEDEAFPYCSTRVRQDVTLITMLTWQTCDDGSPVIVFSRWWCLRIRQSDTNVPEYAVTRIQNGIEGDLKYRSATHQSNPEVSPLTREPLHRQHASLSVAFYSVAKAKKGSKQSRKKRKRGSNASLQTRTYYRRKEEKEDLERKVLALNMQLQQLARRDVVEIRRDALRVKVRRNQELRDSIQGQRIIFANTQSYISEFLRAKDHSLYEPVIQLGTDPRERYETLAAMKQQRLQEAVYFLSERSRHMKMDTDYTDLQRFQSENGDVCLVRFDIKPLPAARDVMQAFEGVLKFSYNLEISISDLVGDITIRENDEEDWDSSVAQHRLVTTINHGVQVDTNNVTFTQYWGDGTGPQPDRAVGNQVGIAVCNYVDEDALYPYHEADRVRQDITFFVVVAKYPRNLPGAFSTAANTSSSVGSPVSTASESGGGVCESSEGHDDVVVATRWTCLRLRKPPFPLDDATATHIRDGMEQVGQAMFTAIHHSVNGPTTPRAAQ